MRSALAGVSVTLSLIMAAGMAGTFFGFSTGVMPGLNAARPASAIDAMQSVNQKIQNPVFVAMFLLVPLLAVAAGVLLLTLDHRSAAILFFVAAAVYFVGALVPSFAVNIPMNNDLDAVTIPTDPSEAARVWSDYSGRWTAWNTVRAVFGWASLLAMSVGVYLWGRD
ncbi:putative membrane protein [Actinomadura pelletieri DSM 43383]|uniref:Putative membrane protein n=1 Tax=Actinomadura pelletieri DSM 43383 TaxID=1120940 RepID=A0A495QM62_9ACTN|nr:anthrone oxygenase family protein [Actinomadura pelletieri]RKS73649.1 putative membrane protein [Actinomadura pelletieri DSM 43383]